jgi:tRNA(Ile2) C34 agmatinyltransferase TiaS
MPSCPVCGAMVKKLGRQDRVCCGCGLTWTVVTERDELDAKADHEVRSREFSENKGAARKIGKVPHRW